MMRTRLVVSVKVVIQKTYELSGSDSFVAPFRSSFIRRVGGLVAFSSTMV